MACKYCGNPTDDGKDVCAACAAAQPEEQMSQQELQNIVEDTFTQAAPEQEVPAAAEETFVLNAPAEVPVKKGGKKGLIALIVAAAIVIAGVLAVALNWDSIAGSFVKSFSSPQEYMNYVEEKAVSEFMDSFCESYGSLFDNPDTATGASSADIHILLGDGLLDILEASMAQSGAAMDTAWLKDILLEVDTNAAGEQLQVDLGVGLGSDSIVNLSLFYDMLQQKLYLGAPEVEDTYLSVDIAQIVGSDVDITAMLQQQLEQNEQLLEALPSEDAVKTLVNKYFGIVLSRVENVEKSTETVKVDGVEQELTVLTATVYEEELYNILQDILKAAKEDKVLEDVIKSFSDYYNDVNRANMEEYYDYAGGTYEEVDLYAQFIEWVDEGLEALPEGIEAADPENYILLDSYVNNDNEIVGRRLRVHSETDGMGEEEISYVTVWQNDRFAFEAKIADAAELTGEGSRANGLLEGTYVLSDGYGAQMLELQIRDLDEKKLEDGYLSGTFRLPISQEMLEGLGLDSMLSGSVALEMTVNTSEDDSRFGLSLLVEGQMMVGITVAGEAVDASQITLPTDCVDAMDQQALMQWIAELDLSGTLDKMKEAGVPAELVDALEYRVSQMQSQF